MAVLPPPAVLVARTLKSTHNYISRKFKNIFGTNEKVKHIEIDKDNDLPGGRQRPEYFYYDDPYQQIHPPLHTQFSNTNLLMRRKSYDEIHHEDCSFAGCYKRTRLLFHDDQNAAGEIKSERFYEEMGYFSEANIPQIINEEEEERRVKKKALTSRIIVLLIQILSISLIPKHENDGFKTTKENFGENEKLFDSFINFVFGGFVNWDGEYFLHIATNGYTHENTIAFFPLFPAIVGFTSTFLYKILFPFMSFHSVALLISWLVNTWCFQETAWALSKLTKICDRGLHNLDSIVVFLFCYNPASIFFSSFYSESMFAYATVSVILSLFEGQLFNSIIYASLSSICRSNGLLNFGFIGAFLLRDFLAIEAVKSSSLNSFVLKKKVEAGCNLAWSLLHCAFGILPFAFFQMYCSWQFCGTNRHVYAGEARKLCDLEQLPYVYIQNKNWNVGFLQYFELKQLPNFMLAAPVLLTLGYESSKRVLFYGNCIWKHGLFQNLPDLAMGVHGLFLAFFCFFCIHVQVSTRMIMSACPYLFIYIAKSLRTEICRLRCREINYLLYYCLICTWFSVYFIGGILLFSRGYPWT